MPAKLKSCHCHPQLRCYWQPDICAGVNLLGSLGGLRAKVDDVLARVREQLLAKPLEVAVDQGQHACAQRTNPIKPQLL